MPMRWTLLLPLFLGALACAPMPRPAVPPPLPPLRVGIAPTAPPLAFGQGGRLAGIEVDLASQLAPALGREVRFVELPFEQLITALLANRIDIIMSGMTVTAPRQFRIAFGDPYLKSGLAALMRRTDATRYDTAAKVLSTSAQVGVVTGTTGEKFVHERMQSATVAVYPTAAAAVTELGQNRIDLFVNDLPVVGWFVSENEAELAMLRTPLTEDALAWGFRPDDDALRSAVNAVLTRWKADGTLRQILQRWLRIWPNPL